MDAIDQSTGSTKIIGHKDIIKGIPKSMESGSVENNAAMEQKIVFEVLYWKYIQDGETMWEIDKLNNVCMINGVDYAKPIREVL